MATVHVDPDELERFARQLKQFNQELLASSTRLNGNFNRLGEFWHDHEYQKYAERYRRAMTVLRRFVEDSEKQIPEFQRKVDALRKYSQR